MQHSDYGDYLMTFGNITDSMQYASIHGYTTIKQTTKPNNMLDMHINK